MAVRVVAIDWSGAMRGAERRIWWAEASAGRLTGLSSGRSRVQVLAALRAEARRDDQLVVGLDFAFSMPTWFVQSLGLSSAPELWRTVREHGETWLRTCEVPFWGRAGRPRPVLGSGRPWLRATEQACPRVAGIGPKSVFQVGGAGAVGTGSLRGMAALDELQRAGFAIWPFDEPRLPLVLEIYPRLLTGAVAKSRPAARQAYLSAQASAMTDELRRLAMSSEDAFDAAVSAVAMERAVGELTALPLAWDAVTRVEGAIWYPGWGTRR
ncbi:MAG: hypothetical protein JO023_15020 [Chloroflexi bacterium]|nr:hypothetical protein [Chloroflexota bacterium]